MVVRNDLLGLQSAFATGLCSQTGHEEGRVDWPIDAFVRECVKYAWTRHNLQDSHIACSQQGSRNALTASRLHTAHRSFIGISS